MAEVQIQIATVHFLINSFMKEFSTESENGRSQSKLSLPVQRFWTGEDLDRKSLIFKKTMMTDSVKPKLLQRPTPLEDRQATSGRQLRSGAKTSRGSFNLHLYFQI